MRAKPQPNAPTGRQAGRLKDLQSYDVAVDVSVGYDANIPPESFALIVVDECHRSLYGKDGGGRDS